MNTPMLIDDRFRVVEVAREGGMGIVYRGVDTHSGESVAIKLMRHVGPLDESRFQREAGVLAQLSFPSIVAFRGHGKLPTGESWLAMEWLDGESLSVRLERGSLSIFEALLVAKAIAGALVAAHERGIVHRDIKPSNIILVGKDPARAKLIDFGLARIKDADRATWSGSLLGTPAYMAPEQIRAASHVDGRADLYALGVVLFECLTGKAPFAADGDVLGAITRALFEVAPRLRDIDSAFPEPLDELVFSLLEKEPQRRLAPANAVLHALEEIDVDADRPSVTCMMFPKPAGLTENELRFASVVLVDPHLTSFVPDDAAPASGRFTSLLTSVERLAAPFHGRVEGLRDGRVLVFFTARGEATDQAIMAARTGLAIGNQGVGAAIGVATGRATAELGSLFSDVAVRAGALIKQSIIHGGAIAIDETTRGLLDQRFLIEREQGALLLATEDLSKKTGRLLCGRPAPFVGREREVTFIQKVFEEVVSEPRASVVIVAGDAGAGKSRLAREVLTALTFLEPMTEIWTASGKTITSARSFGMLATALQRAAEIRDSEAPDVRHQKFATFIEKRTNDKISPSVITFLGEVLGFDTGPDGTTPELRAARRDPILMGDRIRLAFEDLVDSITQNRPLVFVLEDLHWSDVPTIKLLDVSLRKLRTRPFLILALGRSEMFEVFPSLFGERAPHNIRLTGLSRRACHNLVRRVLGDKATNETIAAIVERSAGHPLFLEELVRFITEAPASAGNGLPETVLAMVQSRVSRLPAEARRVMRAASVFGETFWSGGVSKLLGSGDEIQSIEKWLGALCDREIIEERRESRFPNEREYGFRHALFRESAYAMLTDGDKVKGHQLAGLYLEEKGETNAASLAAHFKNAQEPGRGARYLLQVTRQALLGGDFDAVLRHVDELVAGEVEATMKGEALALKAEAMHWRGAYEQAGELADAALKTLEPGSDLWFAALTTNAIAAVRCIHPEKLQSISATLAQWGSDHEWTAGFVEAAVRIGLQAFVGGQYKNARELMGPLEKLLGQSVDHGPRTGALLEFLAAIQANIAWKYDEAITHFFEAGRLYEELGDLRSAAGHRIDACFLLVDLGQCERTIHICEDVLPIVERLSVARHRTTAKILIGTALLHLGRLDESLHSLLDAKKELDLSSDTRTGGSIRNKLGRLHRLRGEFDIAKTMFEEAEQMLATLPRLRAICHANKALLWVEMGQPAIALEQARIAMDLLGELGRMGMDEVIVRYAYVESLRHARETDAAIRELAIAKERVFWIANHLSDAQIKASFLSGIEENRRIVEMQAEQMK